MNSFTTASSLKKPNKMKKTVNKYCLRFLSFQAVGLIFSFIEKQHRHIAVSLDGQQIAEAVLKDQFFRCAGNDVASEQFAVNDQLLRHSDAKNSFVLIPGVDKSPIPNIIFQNRLVVFC